MTDNLGWEKAVLGTALASPASMSDTDELYPSDFTGCHSVLFAEMLDLHRRGALDIRALVESLRTRNLLDTVGDPLSDLGNFATGEAYLADLLSHRGDAMPEYASQVLSASIRRELKQAAAFIRVEAEDTGTPIEDVLDSAERRLTTLRRNRTYEKGLSLGDILSVYMPRIDGLRQGTVDPAWVPECTAIRHILDYVEDTDFVIVAARPGEGKSSWLRYEFYHRAVQNKPATIFNLENTDTEYAKGALALHAGIDSAKIKSPRLLTDAELQRIKSSAEYLVSIPLRIVTLAGPSIKEVERAARREIEQFRASLIGIDYLQLVRNGINDEVQNITATSITVRAMALRYKVPFVAASQLSREIVKRGEHAEPELADLRGSGSLEQDGKIIIFPRALPGLNESVLRAFPDNIEADGSLAPVIRVVPIRFHVLKNTNGPIGVTSPVAWLKHTGDFRTLTNRQAPQ